MKCSARIALAAVPDRFMHEFGFAKPPHSYTYITPSSQPGIYEREFIDSLERNDWVCNAVENGFELELGEKETMGGKQEKARVRFMPSSILYVEMVD